MEPAMNEKIVFTGLRSDDYIHPKDFAFVHGTEESYHIVLSLYEEDGSWLRTLAEAPWVDFIHDGVLVFEREKIAVVMPRHDTYRTVHIPAAARLPHTLSALEQASRDNFGHKKRR